MPTSLDLDEISYGARCINNCTQEGERLGALIYIFNKGLNLNYTIEEINAGSSCINNCIPEGSRIGSLIFLINQLLSAGANSPVVYTNDPNTELLEPADNTKPCLAYSADGTKAIFGWNVTFQLWQ